MEQKKAEDIALELGFKRDNYYNAAQHMLNQSKFSIAMNSIGIKNI